MTSRRVLFRYLRDFTFGLVGYSTLEASSSAAPDVRNKTSDRVDKEKMRKKYSYSADWLDDLEKMQIEWTFVRRGELSGLKRLFSENLEAAEFTWQDAEDVHCVFRIHRRGRRTANFRSLVLKGRPPAPNARNVEKTFRIFNDCWTPVVLSVHPAFGWRDRSSKEVEMALSGEWEFEIEDIAFVETGRY